VSALKIEIREIEFFERPVVLRMPFRFGVVTLREAPQAFIRARIECEDGRESWGAAAEVMVPKWFDKDPALSNAQNIDQLRRSLEIARLLYLANGPATAFGLKAVNHGPQVEECAKAGLNPLVAGYGPALIDRAVLDALCRTREISFFAAMRANLPGIAPGGLAPDLADFDIEAFLAGLTPRQRIHARHTVGLVDPLTSADQTTDSRVGDGLPETLEEVVAEYGHRFFKIKVAGDVAADLARLGAIARVLDAARPDYVVSLDGNEQYDDVEGIVELWRAIDDAPELSRFAAAVAFIEQPITRRAALARDIAPLAAYRPVIIDESDNGFDAFPTARGLGYAGVSSKQCKGVYNSIINAARCANWNAAGGHYFISGEDLTCQAGLGVQQDLALVSLLGLDHVERNGHHYARGMSAAPAAEQEAFAASHPDLYERRDGVTCLRIRDGEINLSSLDAPGFASRVAPDWNSIAEMTLPGRADHAED